MSGAAVPDQFAVSLRNAAFGYAGRSRVARLDLDIEAGSAVALIGPNGSGKSTLLRGLLGLAELTAGSVKVLGTTPVAARKDVATLPQADSRSTELPVTLRQVVAMGLYRKLGPLRPLGRQNRLVIDAALDQVGLSALANRIFGELSGGQQQRAILARALVADPSLLLLDEPFNGMDPRQRLHLMDLLRSLGSQGRTVLFSSHILEEVEELAGTIEVLVAGRHAASGDFRRIRRLMTERPHRYSIRSSDDRRLAAAIIADGSADAVELVGDAVEVRAPDVGRFVHALPRLARDGGVRLVEVSPADESLESVFAYLVAR